MLNKLNVALVFNLKKEADEVSTSGDAGEGERSVEVVARPRPQKTKADTYAEWDTEETILAVKAALEQHHNVTLIEANEEACQHLLQVQPDIVFNIAEGFRGPSREAQIPAILEMLGIPYTGSDPLTLGICLDKARAKEILSYHDIATPPFAVLSNLKDLTSCAVPFPAMVKPLHEGSSKGIFNSSVVRTKKELRSQVEQVLFDYEEPALVEKFLPGREFTVALLGNGDDVRVLPIIEIKFDSLPQGVNPIYSYEAKWVWDTLEHPVDVHECPAKITHDLANSISGICKKAFKILNCHDWCRIDIRLDEGGIPNIIELNPLPGILPNPEEHSCFPQAARAAGLEHSALINSVLDVAAKRYGLA